MKGRIIICTPLYHASSHDSSVLSGGKPLIPPTRDSGRVADTGKVVRLELPIFRGGSSGRAEKGSIIVLVHHSWKLGRSGISRVVELGTSGASTSWEASKTTVF